MSNRHEQHNRTTNSRVTVFVIEFYATRIQIQYMRHIDRQNRVHSIGLLMDWNEKANTVRIKAASGGFRNMLLNPFEKKGDFLEAAARSADWGREIAVQLMLQCGLR